MPYLAGTRPRGDGVVINPIFRTRVAVRPEHDQRGGVRLRQHASEVCSGTRFDLRGAATAGECATTYFTTVFRQPPNPIWCPCKFCRSRRETWLAGFVLARCGRAQMWPDADVPCQAYLPMPRGRSITRSVCGSYTITHLPNVHSECFSALFIKPENRLI